ncbi:MAG: carboxypeptidase regulatory-like domain-containing protein [Thermaceae bacterium]|nr:carboxypeptidase regulatory-like domain-containing protein [Thermaceae bacterium]
MARNEEKFSLEVPLDASSIENFKPEGPIKVALVSSNGKVTSKTLTLSAKGQGSVSFSFERAPGSLQVVVGPGDASDEEIVGLQTLTQTLSASAWRGQANLKLPITISAYYWYWWWRWCRTFSVTGRVVCPDGSPVPGATVCAYDVDWWWWWSSLQQVGCAVTDANGSFTLKFRWCCGWWPWWWWKLRDWRLEPRLVDKILPILEGENRFSKIPMPSPKPSLGIFQELLAERGALTRPPENTVNVAALPSLREQLLQKLPTTPELQRLRVWPWWPWEPWWDCNPDLIFKVTQDCRERGTVIVDENFWDARWDIPTNLSVTLVANDQACCVPNIPDPEGNCMVFDQVCSTPVSQIGGNLGAPAPEGFANPGVIAVYADRPFADSMVISGLFGSTANVDYYELEWSSDNINWNAMPQAAVGGFSRAYYHSLAQPYVPVGFSPATIGGRYVYESREHATARIGGFPPNLWLSDNYNTLMVWLSKNLFADGLYYLRVVAYNDGGSGTLINRRILPFCSSETPNGLKLTLDNIGNPNLEPAADISDVRIGGMSVGPCTNVQIGAGSALDIDFTAYDVDGHLALYSLIATYGKNLAVDVLDELQKCIAGGHAASLTSVALGVIPAADFSGPDYGVARTQGAAAPIWHGGGLRLHIPSECIHKIFPETCCYQLELRVYKRTIVGCDYYYTPNKLVFYSFTVVV